MKIRRLRENLNPKKAPEQTSYQRSNIKSKNMDEPAKNFVLMASQHLLAEELILQKDIE